MAAALAPPRLMPIHRAAERHRVITRPGGVKVPFSFDHMPWIREVHDWMQSRDVGEIYVSGPVQFTKTELYMSTVITSALYWPANFLFILPGRVEAVDFVSRRMEALLDDTSDDKGAKLRAYLGSGRGDDKQFSKVFKSGMRVDFLWPTPGAMSSKSVPYVFIEELDRIKRGIAGEGSIIALARGRVTDFGKDGKIAAACSPSKDDGDAGDNITTQVDMGSFHVVAVPCLNPDCGEYFTPGFDFERRASIGELRIPEEARRDPEQARAMAYVECPCCHHRHSGPDQFRMVRRGVLVSRGQWVDKDGVRHGPEYGGRVRSLSVHGIVHPKFPWGDLAAELVSAELAFEKTGSEEQLKAVYNNRLAIRYESRAAKRKVTAEKVKARAEADGYRMGWVPPGVRFLVGSVDIQGDRFAVAIHGYNEFGEAWLVERFDIRQLADGKTDIAPGQYREHWAVLLSRVIRAKYRLMSNPDLCLPVAATVIDVNGEPGVADNAKWFWHYAREEGVTDLQLTFIKGATTTDAAPLAAKPTYWEALPNGKPDEGGAYLYLVGSHQLKDMMVNRLSRETAGPTARHFPVDLPDKYFAEMTSEHRVNGRWTKKNEHAPNEQWDLECYSWVAWLRCRPEAVDWNKPPRSAMPVPWQGEQGPASSAVSLAVQSQHSRPAARRRGVRGGVF